MRYSGTISGAKWDAEMIARNPNFVVHPPCIPSAFTFATVIGIRELSTSEPSSLRVRVIDPEGKVIHDSGIAQLHTVENRRVAGHGRYEGAIMGHAIQNLFLDNEGIYQLACEVNGEVLTPQKVPVFL